MTDKDRLIRDERVKLRRRHQEDLNKLASLECAIASQRTRIQELLHSLELAKTEAAIRRETYEQLCAVLGKLAKEPT